MLPLRLVARPVLRRTNGLARGYSTKKQPNPASQFYKQFTRPIAKVLLLAVFTYQFVYWGWVKLETDEIRAEKEAEIATLEAKIDEYKKLKNGEKSA